MAVVCVRQAALCGVNGGGVRIRLGTVVRSALRGGKRARTHACARPGAGVAWRGTALGQCTGCGRAGGLARLCGGRRRGPGLRGTASACPRPGSAWRGAARSCACARARAGRGGARELGKWGERARKSGAGQAGKRRSGGRAERGGGARPGGAEQAERAVLGSGQSRGRARG
ncbi:spidroin-1-like [Panicum virgatum]|uniref:spidroin-1-like n=1 Tax=Panicum virgatum TaxID=38727 RepID=UPI0019D526F6|nr:spidroin-1-like [Panicum virgatum]